MNTAIERTYDEWHDSEYSYNGQECQSCHMPDVTAKAAIMGPERKNVATHWFNGGNVALLSHFGQPENAQRSRDLLKRAASIAFVDLPELVAGRDAVVKVQVTNRGAGHKLPSGFPEGREMWIDFTVTDATGAVVYRLGAIKNGETEPGTQNFRVHLGDKDGHEVATEVWKITHIIADNRIPPEGIDVRDFVVPIPLDAKGPFTLSAKLNYWPFAQGLVDELLGPGKLPVEVVTMGAADAKVPVAPAQVARLPDLQRPTPVAQVPSAAPAAAEAAMSASSRGAVRAERSESVARELLLWKAWLQRSHPNRIAAATGPGDESSGSGRPPAGLDGSSWHVPRFREFMLWAASRNAAPQNGVDP